MNGLHHAFPFRTLHAMIAVLARDVGGGPAGNRRVVYGGYKTYAK